MPIDPNNPFNFTYPPGQNFWGTAELHGGSPEPNTHGATASYGSICAGTFNTADNFFHGSGANAGSSPFNYGNSLSGYDGPGNSYVASILGSLVSPTVFPTANGGSGQSGPDSFGDVTVVNTAVSRNPVFAADNIFFGLGSIGLYGRSRGTGFSVGVLGQSSTGCGMFGLATDENATSRGIGVVGRSVAGAATEAKPVEDVMESSIGVLGQSALGTGVRGQGGPLLPIPFAKDLILQTTPNTPVSIDLTLGSIGSPTTAHIVTLPPNGILIPSAGETLVDFQPDAKLTVGKETSFTYTLANAAGTSRPATATVFIVPASPKPPFALAGSLEIASAATGAVFSAGQLGSEQIPVNGGSGKAAGAVLQQVSRDALAQLQLVPFASFSDKPPPALPTAGLIGDLFLCLIATHQPTSDTPLKTAAQLWICTGYVMDKAGNALPQWQPVQLGLGPLTGGTPIPLSPAPWL
jgi:hypothetical protein